MADHITPEYAADIPPVDPAAKGDEPVPPAAPKPEKQPSEQSPGLIVILAVAAISSLIVGLRSYEEAEGLEMWTFANNHEAMYRPMLPEINDDLPEGSQVDLKLIAYPAMQRRMLSGFASGTPTADLLEVEGGMAASVFAGPLEDIGFTDITDKLREEGLLERLNPPSLSPWTKQGRIFGLPHDVHPVMLGYRADLIEAAGVDVDQIETWDDFERVMRPLREDFDGDGRWDRYPLAVWPTNMADMRTLFLQAGGGLFDPQGQPQLDHPRNIDVAARVVSWSGGPDAIAAEVADSNQAGNQLRVEGFVLSELVPDWMAGVWKKDVKGLAGKVKLMPLPAWEPGGLRTSVQGGSMLAISDMTDDFDTAWTFAKKLYLDRDLAQTLFETTCIVSPVVEYWDAEFYDEPVEFYSGQPIGRMFLDLAPEVPLRGTSPFRSSAEARMTDAMYKLLTYARQNNVWDPEALRPEAERLLRYAQGEVVEQIERNPFVQSTTRPTSRMAP